MKKIKIPCKNCIVFPICNSYINDQTNKSILEVMDYFKNQSKCNILDLLYEEYKQIAINNAPTLTTFIQIELYKVFKS